jgi:hypothetical protein
MALLLLLWRRHGCVWAFDVYIGRWVGPGGDEIGRGQVVVRYVVYPTEKSHRGLSSPKVGSLMSKVLIMIDFSY